MLTDIIAGEKYNKGYIILLIEKLCVYSKDFGKKKQWFAALRILKFSPKVPQMLLGHRG